MGDQLEDRAAGADLDDGGGVSMGKALQLRTEPVESLAVSGGDPCNETSGRFGSILSGSAWIDPGGSFADQALEGAVGVRPGESRFTGDCVPRPGPGSEQHLINQTLGGRKSKLSQVYLGHISSVLYYRRCRNLRCSAATTPGPWR